MSVQLERWRSHSKKRMLLSVIHKIKWQCRVCQNCHPVRIQQSLPTLRSNGESKIVSQQLYIIIVRPASPVVLIVAH